MKLGKMASPLGPNIWRTDSPGRSLSTCIQLPIFFSSAIPFWAANLGFGGSPAPPSNRTLSKDPMSTLMQANIKLIAPYQLKSARADSAKAESRPQPKSQSDRGIVLALWL